MKTSTIKASIEQMGYKMDTLMHMPLLTSIMVKHDANYFNHIYKSGKNRYTDAGRVKFKFNSSTEMLEIVEGETNPETGEFVSNHGETSNYTVDVYIPFDLIAGFSMSNFLSYGGHVFTKEFLDK